jgi:hypothetical protein
VKGILIMNRKLAVAVCALPLGMSSLLAKPASANPITHQSSSIVVTERFDDRWKNSARYDEQPSSILARVYRDPELIIRDDPRDVLRREQRERRDEWERRRRDERRRDRRNDDRWEDWRRDEERRARERRDEERRERERRDEWEQKRRDEERRERDRRDEWRRERDRRDEYCRDNRRDDDCRDNWQGDRRERRRVWVPGHYESGLLGIGRRWVEGRWEYRD